MPSRPSTSIASSTCSRCSRATTTWAGAAFLRLYLQNQYL